MKLTQAQQDRIRQWLDESFACLKCPEKKRYSVDLVTTPVIASTQGKSLTMLAVTCDSCGFVQFYSRKSPAISALLV